MIAAVQDTADGDQFGLNFYTRSSTTTSNDDVNAIPALYLANDNTATFGADVTVPDEAYGAGWNGSLEVPTKNAVYDKIEALGSG